MTLTTTRPEPDSLATARRAMIDSQLRTSGVNDERVLARMLSVAREEHVPAKARGTAYIDRAITLDNGRKIAAPLFYGMALEEAQPQAEDDVLIVDAGSHYLTALVEPMAASVDAISPEEALTKSRKRKSYSLVLVDGAIEHVPDTLTGRLSGSGRIVTGAIINGVTRLATGRKSSGGNVVLLPLAEIGIPHLSEFDKPTGWSF